MEQNIETVDLSAFWSLYSDIDTEFSQAQTYQDMSKFWTTYLGRITASAQQMQQTNGKVAGSWTSSSASKAFQDSMDQGRGSLQTHAQAVSTVPRQFDQLTESLNASHQVADDQKRQLLTLQKAQLSTGLLIDEGPTIQEADKGDVLVDESTAGSIRSIMAALQTAHDKLGKDMAQVAGAMQSIPDPQWKGPGGAGAGGGTDQSGGAAKQAGSGGGGSPTSSDAASGAGDSAGDSAGDGAGDSSGDSAGDTGADSSTQDPSGSPVVDPATDDTTSPPPSTTTPDPSLAGSSVATLPPPTTSFTPSPNPMPMPSPVPPVSSSSGPLTFPPMTFAAPPKVASGGGGGSIADTEPGPTPLAAEESVATGATTSGSSGFYPPMMPPMSPGGARSGDVQAGEAAGAGGPAIRWQGRDSTRAGLVPELQGRGGSDDEPAEERRARGGEVLDEELWQVTAFASPVTPPGLDPRRGRSRGY